MSEKNMARKPGMSSKDCDAWRTAFVALGSNLVLGVADTVD